MGAGFTRKRLFADNNDNGSGSTGATPVYNDLDPVISQLNTPPAHVSGERYLINTAPTGAWVGSANNVAESDGALWTYTAPTLNDYVYITSTLVTMQYNGSAWVPAPARAILQNGNTFGPSGIRVGTNDAYPTWLKYNNTLRVRIDGTDVRTPGSLYLGIPSMASAATARLHVRGTGATSATYSVKIEDSAAAPLFMVRNDGNVGVGVLAPLAKLHVVGTETRLDTTAFYWTSDAGVYAQSWIYNNASYAWMGYGTNDYLKVQSGAVNLRGTNYVGITATSDSVMSAANGTLAISDLAVSGTRYIRLTTTGTQITDPALITLASTVQNIPTIQTGRVGLSAGDLYKDTAANILAAGDLIIARRV